VLVDNYLVNGGKIEYSILWKLIPEYGYKE
jgi:hypothetical protein